MKYRKVTIVTERALDADPDYRDEHGVTFAVRGNLLINEKIVPHHGFQIGLDDEEGFLALTILNVEKEAFENFMADETPDDVLEGTGTPMITEDGATTLGWNYGANIVLPVHDLELRVLAPKDVRA